MPETMIADDLWKRIAPLLPRSRRGRCRRRPIPPQEDLAEIVMVLREGIPWQTAAAEKGGRSRLAWRRLRQWQFADNWSELREALLGG